MLSWKTCMVLFFHSQGCIFGRMPPLAVYTLCGFLASHVAEPDLESIIDVWPPLETISTLPFSCQWHMCTKIFALFEAYLNAFSVGFVFALPLLLFTESVVKEQLAWSWSKLKKQQKCHSTWVMESPRGTNMHHLVITWNCFTTRFCDFDEMCHLKTFF